ncbi:MAG: protein kinase [Planctomycetes bacterium]|nr:protein kinase [Planctomycetota bacterium]
MEPDDTLGPAEIGEPESSGRVDDLVARYLDRLNRGEKLDPLRILAEHPDLGGEILKTLEVFAALGSAEPTAAVSSHFGDYTIRRQLGRGGMGVVYEAWENSMDRPVALKVLPAIVAADERAVLRFVREAQIAGKLSHPNVVSVYGMGVKEQIPYYVMELVEGRTLAQILARWKDAPAEEKTPFGFPRDDVAHFSSLARAFADTADGLQHAHGKGVIHRDIKPSNLILDRQGRLRILDFGLARLEGQESLTASGGVLGTPLYMSPEQARRKKIPLDHRTDIYSLGATLYELLTLRPPFQGKDHQDTLSQIIERDPVEPRKINPRIPRDLETIVLKCLRKDPGHRYGTAEALAQDLRRFARGDPVEARPQTRWARVHRKLWRRRIALVMTVVAFALLATLSLLVFQYTSRQRAARNERYLVILAETTVELHLNHFAGRLTQSRIEGFQRELDVMESGGGPRERLKRQLDRLDEAARLSPERSEAAYYRARVLTALRRDDDARAQLAVLIHSHPRYTPAIALLAMLEGKYGKTAAASELRERLRSIESEGRIERWLDANEAAMKREWSRAVYSWTEHLRLGEGQDEFYPGSTLDALVERGRARLATGDLFGASSDFVQASVRAPRALGPILLEAYTLLLHKSEKAKMAAEEWLQTAFARTAHRDEFALGAASLYLDSWIQDPVRAHAWLDRISAARLGARARLAAHINLAEWREAAELGEKLLVESPGDSFVAASLAMVQFEQGERESAVCTLEEVLGLPGAKEQALDQIADYRRAILPKVVSFASCEAAIQDARSGTASIPDTIDRLTKLAQANSANRGITDFIQGRLLDLNGDIAGAVASFTSAANEAPGRGEPILRLAESMRRAGRSLEAELALRQAIAAGREPAWDLWIAWFRVCDDDMKISPAQMLERIPIAPKLTPPSKLDDDMTWLLENLRHGTLLAIDCGSDKDAEFDGKRWSRDRFFWSRAIRRAAERLDPCPEGPHRTARFFDEDQVFAGYRIPLPHGEYRVTLRFAEYWSDRFYVDVWIEGKRLLKDFHVLGKVGWATEGQRSFDVAVDDCVLDLQFGAAEGRRRFPVHVAGIEIERAR